MWTEIVRCKRLELPESDGWHKMEDKKTPKPLVDKIITHLQKCRWERADLIPLHHFCIPRNICQDIIFRGSFFLNAAICKRASAICCLSKNSCVFHIYLLAASTGRVTCSQPIAIMCRLITVTPRCGDTDRLHLSERCRDTGAMMLPRPAGRQMHRVPLSRCFQPSIPSSLCLRSLKSICHVQPHSRSKFCDEVPWFSRQKRRRRRRKKATFCLSASVLVTDLTFQLKKPWKSEEFF